jgi:hypothetical protein
MLVSKRASSVLPRVATEAAVVVVVAEAALVAAVVEEEAEASGLATPPRAESAASLGPGREAETGAAGEGGRTIGADSAVARAREGGSQEVGPARDPGRRQDAESLRRTWT